MAVNQSRSMNAEFSQGTIDETYIQLAPDRGGVIQHYPTERLSWPTYRQAELHADPPMSEGLASRAGLPVEYKTASARIANPPSPY